MATIQEVIAGLSQATNGANANARQALDAVKSIAQSIRQIQTAQQQQQQQLQTFTSNRKTGRDGTLYIEDIPGRRIPFDVVVNIPVGADVTSTLTGTYVLSQDGPFVATIRYMTFLSQFVLQVSDGASVATFNGRSFGRFRPVHSALDLMDAIGGYTNPAITLGAFPGASPALQVAVNPNNHSPFRTMEFDGTVKVKATNWPRQSGEVPTSLWAPGLDGNQQLPVLDYFERGETLEFEVTPTKTNNPAAGNIQSISGALPYLAGQYDAHEGIGYSAAVPDPSTADTITRRPDGIVTLGYFGFRILAPPGASLL